ncbi:Met22p [Sugiyamaella lignohabitans]|uniref:3'(2'),5'-bisphosphate nucleotidase n=1 Tax=Sugiyamaella lignohabitans TaxID=796027 RepID=A0A167F5T8_9ASCO|nr:Met22p [Sugiyamaella lignohabitans]ANB14869.1 Met22p [Sugiyamaella lignohabitans]
MGLFSVEKRIAQLAVQRASRLTAAVAARNSLSSITKSDDSPVTVADFGAQAIIISAIRHAFPKDEVVGEEDGAKLRADAGLRENVWKLVQDASNDSFASEIGQLKSADEMIDAIDHGNSEGGNSGRIWALDPIDGTKGFLRRGQYAVCLALMVDGKVQVGVIGCPNLPLQVGQSSAPAAGEVAGESGSEGNGALFTAVRGEGAFVSPLFSAATESNTKQIHFNAITSTANATFCESVESGHSAHDTQAAIASALGITKPPVRMDSQAKYCSIARGDGDIYLRLPVSSTYQEKIWDHAAGNVLVHEAGGRVTDMFGKELDFGVGRTLRDNKGVIAASAAIHSDVLKAVHQVVNSSN